MHAADLERVMAIAASLPQAPQWPVSAYQTAIDPELTPRRIAVVVENRQTGRIAGFAVASFATLQAELESIAVAADAQGQGIGSQLLSWLIDHMKAIGATDFILEVRASNNKALALYSRLGWKESGRRARYYAEPEEDAVLMRLEVR
jgi:ribosomal-protein-alanine N-acetyltransferase